MENNGDLRWGHQYNIGIGSIVLNSKSRVRGDICQRYALPAELQPHDNSSNYKLILNWGYRKFYQQSIKRCHNVDKGTYGSVFCI
jgi:hypothetical protein